MLPIVTPERDRWSPAEIVWYRHIVEVSATVLARTDRGP
jgi:hypothetical protein